MNPELLPKLRSRALLDECRHMPCTLRIAGFAGLLCSPASTVVGCHLPTIGKGTATKVSDLYVAAGCQTCHDILDHRGMKSVREKIADQYPAAFMERLMRAHHETMAYWLAADLIQVKGARVL